VGVGPAGIAVAGVAAALVGAPAGLTAGGVAATGAVAALVAGGATGGGFADATPASASPPRAALGMAGGRASAFDVSSRGGDAAGFGSILAAREGAATARAFELADDACPFAAGGSIGA
jgi:hypothetical protein